MPRLFMRRGPTTGASYLVTAAVVSIGRGSKNDIVIHDNEVSRDHCRLTRGKDGYELEDLNSSNGTYLDGQPIVGARLVPYGGLIELGDSITFEYQRADDDSTAPDQEVDTEEVPSGPVTERAVAALAFRSGPDRGRLYTLVTPVVTLGRDLSNDIIIQDPDVSRFHARIRRENGAYHLEDLDSTNGTRVNAEYVRATVQLHPGDVVVLGGSVELRFLTGVAPSGIEEQPTATRQLVRDAQAHETRQTNLPNPARPTGLLRSTSALGTGLDPRSLESHVFLAYAREDWEPIVAALTLGLQDAGVEVWVDQYLVPGAMDWRDAVEQAMSECWLLIPVLSSASLSSPYVKTTYRYFVNHDKPLIPLLTEPQLTLPLELARRRAVFYAPDNASPGLHKLIYAIKELHRQTPP